MIDDAAIGLIGVLAGTVAVSGVQPLLHRRRERREVRAVARVAVADLVLLVEQLRRDPIERDYREPYFVQHRLLLARYVSPAQWKSLALAMTFHERRMSYLFRHEDPEEWTRAAEGLVEAYVQAQDALTGLI